MITIASTIPCFSLDECISNYTRISFNTNGSDLIYPLVATPSCSLIFFLKDQPVFSKNDVTGNYLKGSFQTILQGVFDQFNGQIKCNGDYLIFIVRFTVSGFFKLFGLSPSSFTNKLISTKEIAGRSLTTLFTQLQRTDEISKMAELSNQFFKASAKRQSLSFVNDEKTPVSDMLKINSSLPILAYANRANMSVRSFERKFIEQVGVSPKMYCSLLRFNSAVQLKFYHREKSWASVAHECGYYDQMHLIRDFKKFADTTPARLLERIAALPVEFIDATEKVA